MHLTPLPQIPLIQAPMAGGITTPALVSAVADAGAIGSFGFAYSNADKIASDLKAARASTTGLINANFFIIQPPEIPAPQAIEDAATALAELPFPPASANPAHVDNMLAGAPSLNLTEQLEPLWEMPPDYLTFHFGIPSAEIIERAKSHNIAIGITATSLQEAKQIKQAGADFIIAQGQEAGGHRGTFTPNCTDDERLDTIALTKCLSQEIALPVASAGGIMSGADMKEALQAGASLVQMGTAFLCANEAGTNHSYRAALTAKQGKPTCFTRHFSGRDARSIQNAFIEKMQDKPYLPFPYQNKLTASLRGQASKDENSDYQSLWAGTNYQRIIAAPAADIIAKIMDE